MEKIQCPVCGHLNPGDVDCCGNCYANVSWMKGSFQKGSKAQTITQPSGTQLEATAPAQLAITDIHEGDYFAPIAVAAGVLALMALALESSAAVWWLLDIVALGFFLSRVWQRVKWSRVRLPPEGYQIFAKGEYISGHTELITPEQAILGLTPERIYLSTINGRLEGLHLLEVGGVRRELEQEKDRGKTIGKFFVGLILRSPYLILGGTAKRDRHIVVVTYQYPSGMKGEIRFAIANRRAADQMINAINSAVQHFHAWMAQQVWPQS